MADALKYESVISGETYVAERDGGISSDDMQYRGLSWQRRMISQSGMRTRIVVCGW